MYRENVKKNNPIAYQVIKNSISSNKVSHSFLFSANIETEVTEEPLFLFQSLISKNPFDSNNLTSLENYVDFQTIDGSESEIKKEDVVNAILKLQETSFEKGAPKLLLIKNIENANSYSLNSLLKFIEEPTKDTYIAMTTNNIRRILPTIISRSQIINILPQTYDYKVQLLQNSNVPKKHIGLLAELNVNASDLNTFYTSHFIDLVENIISILKSSLSNKEKIITELQSLITKNNFKISTNLLRMFFDDIWRHREGLETYFHEKELHAKYFISGFDYERALYCLNEFLVIQNNNVNFDLSKNKLLINIKECFK